jgi:hypothetical protein
VKITKWIESSQEVEIEIGADDVIAALMDGSENYTPKQAVFAAANKLAQVFRKLPQSSIDDLNDDQRKLIGDFLDEQAKRFRATAQAVA